MKECAKYNTAGAPTWYILEVNMEHKVLDRHRMLNSLSLIFKIGQQLDNMERILHKIYSIVEHKPGIWKLKTRSRKAVFAQVIKIWGQNRSEKG